MATEAATEHILEHELEDKSLGTRAVMVVSQNSAEFADYGRLGEFNCSEGSSHAF